MFSSPLRQSARHDETLASIGSDELFVIMNLNRLEFHRNYGFIDT
jgi:hypothetical protein